VTLRRLGALTEQELSRIDVVVLLISKCTAGSHCTSKPGGKHYLTKTAIERAAFGALGLKVAVIDKASRVCACLRHGKKKTNATCATLKGAEIWLDEITTDMFTAVLNAVAKLPTIVVTNCSHPSALSTCTPLIHTAEG
jgi:hypothetical protein